MTEKRNGRIKARKCAICRKQRDFDGYNKADRSSPTVSTKVIILSVDINVHCGLDVATIYIPNAFLWADNNGKVLMKLRCDMIELLVDLDPSLYIKYIVVGENGEPLLYVKLLKALYGILRSALLFYKKL